MQKMHLLIASLFLIVGCGTTSSQANLAPQYAPVAPQATAGVAPAMAMPQLGACHPGTPQLRCKTLINATPNILVSVYIDNQRVPSLFPYGGTVPLARLLPNDKTQVSLMMPCTRYDKDGYCVRTVTADAYEAAYLPVNPPTMDPALSVVPIVTEETRHCYYMEFAVPRSGDRLNWPIAIQDSDNRTCPNKIVPKGKEQVDDTPTDDVAPDEEKPGADSPKS